MNSQNIDGELYSLKIRAAFLTAACNALGEVSDDVLDLFADKNAWLGLGNYIDDLALEIKKLYDRANGEQQ